LPRRVAATIDNPTPDPRYNRPANSCGVASRSSAFATGALIPKKAAAINAKKTPRLRVDSLDPDD
jgi:hypothetical protein